MSSSASQPSGAPRALSPAEPGHLAGPPLPARWLLPDGHSGRSALGATYTSRDGPRASAPRDTMPDSSSWAIPDVMSSGLPGPRVISSPSKRKARFFCSPLRAAQAARKRRQPASSRILRAGSITADAAALGVAAPGLRGRPRGRAFLGPAARAPGLPALPAGLARGGGPAGGVRRRPCEAAARAGRDPLPAARRGDPSGERARRPGLFWRGRRPERPGRRAGGGRGARLSRRPPGPGGGAAWGGAAEAGRRWAGAGAGGPALPPPPPGALVRRPPRNPASARGREVSAQSRREPPPPPGPRPCRPRRWCRSAWRTAATR